VPVRVEALQVIKAVPAPRTRADCEGPGVCVKIGCRFNLAISVNDHGNIKIEGGPALRNTDRGWRGPADFDERVIEWLETASETCALDAAERGGMTLEEVGELLNMTRERARQIEEGALRKLRHLPQFKQFLRAMGVL